ncbi:uncharacterized protein ASPGLDRAFT_371475 [Aspergillus glaucus CBS 516.65]|uniref:Uncharacterized protein n=1 Tax=Aspergillus glaucus CBS 516.65 TaxID=1160497 RepID=A0A1L9VJE5_ASPGL|nr:hypothetical protein ASPGLDRAFT_371475 [Aspergillus glaucus CBS 516.65]OJJ83995.1 hypothetical protein ASPGLDRAFT_371475 [Aspergillus glaucus CBS 516.65]
MLSLCLSRGESRRCTLIQAGATLIGSEKKASRRLRRTRTKRDCHSISLSQMSYQCGYTPVARSGDSQSRTRSHSGLWIQYGKGKALSALKTPPIEKFEKAAGPIGEAFTNPRRLWGYIADWWWVLFTDNKTKIVVSHVARVRVTRVPIS